MVRLLKKGGGPISAILWMVVVMPPLLGAGTLDMDARAAWLWATTAATTTTSRPVDVTAGKTDPKPCKQCPLSCPCDCQKGEPCRCLHSKPKTLPAAAPVVVYPSYRYLPVVQPPVYYQAPTYYGGGTACAGGG